MSLQREPAEAECDEAADPEQGDDAIGRDDREQGTSDDPGQAHSDAGHHAELHREYQQRDRDGVSSRAADHERDDQERHGGREERERREPGREELAEHDLCGREQRHLGGREGAGVAIAVDGVATEGRSDEGAEQQDEVDDRRVQPRTGAGVEAERHHRADRHEQHEQHEDAEQDVPGHATHALAQFDRGHHPHAAQEPDHDAPSPVRSRKVCSRSPMAGANALIGTPAATSAARR